MHILQSNVTDVTERWPFPPSRYKHLTHPRPVCHGLEYIDVMDHILLPLPALVSLKVFKANVHRLG